jgi:hypothetical protein
MSEPPFTMSKYASELDLLRDKCAWLERELAAKVEECEGYKRAARKIEQALLPDPHDEREVSVEWLRKTVSAALREGK